MLYGEFSAKWSVGMASPGAERGPIGTLMMLQVAVVLTLVDRHNRRPPASMVFGLFGSSMKKGMKLQLSVPASVRPPLMLALMLPPALVLRKSPKRWYSPYM